MVDIRYEDQVAKAFEDGAKKFGGIDILINNASAISLYIKFQRINLFIL